MPARTLTMVVEGRDTSSAALASAENSVMSLGSTVDGVGSRMMSFADHVEMGRREMALVPVGASAAAAGIAKTGSASSAALQPLMYLASSFGLISRRSAVAMGRVGQLGGTFSSMGGSAAGLAVKLGTVAAVALPVIQAVQNVVKVGRVAIRVVTNLGKRFLDWTKLLERSPAALAGLTAGEREAARGAEDLAWAIDQLTPSSSRAERGMQSQSEMAEQLGRSVEQLMAKYPGLSRAAAATASELEYERQAAMRIVRDHEQAESSVDKLGGAVTTLGGDIRTALTPALEALAVPALALVNEYGPRMITWARDLAKAFTTEVPDSIHTTIRWLDDLDRALMNIFRGPANLLRGIFGKEPLVPRGMLGTPMQAPQSFMPTPGYMPIPRTIHPGPRDVIVSGSIDVRVSGDLRGAGAEIGRGIQGELQRVGME